MKTAFDVLTTATDLVGGDRKASHGAMAGTFDRIAALWSAYLGGRDNSDKPLTGSEVCDLMELLKIARRQDGTFNPDDYVDGAGYAACAFQCRCEAS